MYLTCNDLIVRHPCVTLWGWDAKKIGVFNRCLLIKTRRFGDNRLSVDESSMIRLIEFVHDCCMENYRLKQDPNEVFMSYEEVLDYFPEAEFYNWTPTIMGLLCSAQLLLGKYCSKEARKLVSVSSVNRLINYTNDRFKRISNLRNHE